ncbi:MAG: glutamate dehydrogenase, partial [Sphingomonadaceae bacterium]|nr:glutamate dehydrogenase [Sphingomonadaceae bacterium]
MNNVAHDPLSESMIDAIAAELTASALPGETDDFDEKSVNRAARFVAEAAYVRPPGRAVLKIDSTTGRSGRRFMRLAVINDDMPFIVDSVTSTVTAHSLAVMRLLHPIVSVLRDEDHRAVELNSSADGALRESIVYLEIERADSRTRNELLVEIERVLADVRAAVGDWKDMTAQMEADAQSVEDEEGRALLTWFADHHFTQVGHYFEDRDGNRRSGLGIFRVPGPSCWSERIRAAAFEHFDEGGDEPLLTKADRIATVHRRVPLDLVIVPVRENGKVVELSIHAGLWTSAALNAPAHEIPVLRQRLEQMEKELGFDPKTHTGKALQHALSRLPHDILIAFGAHALKHTALTAMSLADRPRPKLLLVPGALGRHLFAFVWLPRDELSTGRRTTIGGMLETATSSLISSWSVELGDGELALIRYTLDLAEGATQPDAAALDMAIEQMVRGWAMEVESELGERVPSARAARLALTYAEAFPEGYRTEYGPQEAAMDVLRFRNLTEQQRGSRLYRHDGDREGRLRLKLYRLGASIPLSDAVPVLENFGFRVLEEQPTALGGGRLGYIHDFLLEVEGDADPDGLLERARIKEGAISAVLEGKAENDAFNQLIIAVGLDPRDVTLLRAWFRYLRQTGLAYSLSTVVETLREEPEISRAIIALFDALHDPAFDGDREAATKAANESIDGGLINVAAIDDDTILRAIRSVVQATLRTNAFAPAASEALAFKLQSDAIPNLPAPVPWREIWVYSPRVEGIHLRGGPVARGGLRWSDRRDDFRT